MTEETTAPRIRVLTDDNFMAFTLWISSEVDNLETVFTSEFSPEIGGPSEQLYVKIYPPNSKGLINEVTGWLLNESLNIPQPEKAFLIQLDIKKLPKEGATNNTKTLLNHLEESGVNKIICFATSTIRGYPSAIKVSKGLEELPTVVNDVRKWPNLHMAIMGDEKMANTDRHFNNLLRVSSKQYFLIDNGRLFSDSGNWCVDDLDDPLVNLTNKLSEFVLDNPVQSRDSSKILYLAETKLPNKQCLDEVLFWSKYLIRDKTERNRFENFLRLRIQNIETIIKQRYGMIA